MRNGLSTASFPVLLPKIFKARVDACRLRRTIRRMPPLSPGAGTPPKTGPTVPRFSRARRLHSRAISFCAILSLFVGMGPLSAQNPAPAALGPENLEELRKLDTETLQ